MTTLFLKEFIRTGKFGAVTIGSTKEDIISELGNDFESFDLGESQAILFDWYEFFYWTDTGKIYGIQNDHLQADCINHKEMIELDNKEWTLDIWFLKTGQNITFKEVKQILTKENIQFIIQPAYLGCNENVIKCVDSNVTFDFCSEYSFVELDDNKNFKETVECKKVE